MSNILADLFISLFNFIIDSLASIANVAIMLLPKSPFSLIENADVTQYLGYLNWVIPVQSLLTLTAYWLSAIAIYYVVSVILRWVKVIQ